MARLFDPIPLEPSQNHHKVGGLCLTPCHLLAFPISWPRVRLHATDLYKIAHLCSIQVHQLRALTLIRFAPSSSCAAPLEIAAQAKSQLQVNCESRWRALERLKVTDRVILCAAARRHSRCRCVDTAWRQTHCRGNSGSDRSHCPTCRGMHHPVGPYESVRQPPSR